VPEVEFGQRQVANSIRERLSGFLADNDSRRSKTVELKDAVPDEMVQRVQEEAADSRQAEADEAGQASLSDRERKEIDFSREGVNVPFARSVKGSAQNEGVTDWLQFADLNLTVDENRRVLAEASNEERNRSDLGKSQEKRDIQRAADNKRKRRQQAEGAKQPAFEGDSDAADFLRDEQRLEDDLFDINLRSGSGPTGRDFERLQEAHNNRSERAQRVDERRSAKVTRDPLKCGRRIRRNTIIPASTPFNRPNSTASAAGGRGVSTRRNRPQLPTAASSGRSIPTSTTGRVSTPNSGRRWRI